jgi:hypothetical protein
MDKFHKTTTTQYSHFVFRQYYKGDKVKYNKISGTCSEHRGIRNAKENLISKDERMKPLGVPSLGWEGTFKNRISTTYAGTAWY